MVLGTAGHIDHGKSALVRALTGIDPDRLPEEKRRGITIELGFASLQLDDGRTVGVVDVPGHEAFVRTMVAGATGVDLALLVVAADEGVMPQTREHLAILTLLGVRGGVVAISKADLVDQEWLDLVRDDLQICLRGSALENAAVVVVSAKTGAGLAELRSAIALAAGGLQAPVTDDLFRMPVDRVFSLRGTGTVVTGTVWSGALRKGAAWIHPPGRAVRVRELHSHGDPVEVVSRGMRAAVALADATVGEIERGATLVSSDEWQPTRAFRGSLHLLDAIDVRLTPRTHVRLHVGAADIGARVVMLGPDFARLHLGEAILCRSGDRFVLRGGPRLTTLGGGTVVDPYPRSRARTLAVAERYGAPLLRAYCAESGSQGVERRLLAVRLGVSPHSVDRLLCDSGLCITESRVYDTGVVDAARERLVRAVDRAHAVDPLGAGVSLSEARTSTAVPDDLFDRILGELITEEVLATSGAHVHRHGWQARLDGAQAGLAERMMHAFCSSHDPTTESRVVELYGSSSLPVLRHLEREGSVVRLGDAVIGEPVVRSLVERLRGHMVPGRRYTPAELRDVLGISRKVLIPLLEYCDRARITERNGSERVLRG